MKKNGLPYRKDSFKVPEGYFEALEDRVLESVDQDMGGENSDPGFAVPEGYFANLEDRVLDRIERESTKTRVIDLFNREAFYYAAGVAAVFVAIVTTFFFDRPQAITYESVDMVTLEDYLDEIWDDPSEQMIQSGEYDFATSSQEDFDYEAVLEYLNENVEEPYVIYNED